MPELFPTSTLNFFLLAICPSVAMELAADRALMARIAAKVNYNPETGCWGWIAGCSTQGEYPQIGGGTLPTTMGAHRAAYLAYFGTVPPSSNIPSAGRIELHHACHDHDCVSPFHLQPLRRAEHMEHHRRIRAERKAALHAQLTSGVIQ